MYTPCGGGSSGSSTLLLSLQKWRERKGMKKKNTQKHVSKGEDKQNTKKKKNSPQHAASTLNDDYKHEE